MPRDKGWPGEHNGSMVTVSVEMIVIIVGVVAVMLTNVGCSPYLIRSVRKEIQATIQALRDDRLRAEIDSLTQRLNAANAHIDSLTESLYLGSAQKAGA